MRLLDPAGRGENPGRRASGRPRRGRPHRPAQPHRMACKLSDPVTATPPTPTEWRAAMGYFPTGVTVVTSWRGDEPVGATINAFCSVSLDPPMLLICLNKANPLCEPVHTSRRLGVNILGHDEGAAVARHFAVAPEDERFTAYPYRSQDGGGPPVKRGAGVIGGGVGTLP